jgi:beta-glucosidase
VTVTVDPRLLATFAGGQWRIAGGSYKVLLGASSRDVRAAADIRLAGRVLPATWRP